jgi:hypothetical protein
MFSSVWLEIEVFWLLQGSLTYDVKVHMKGYLGGS